MAKTGFWLRGAKGKLAGAALQKGSGVLCLEFCVWSSVFLTALILYKNSNWGSVFL